MKQRLIDANALHYRMGVNQDDKQIFYVTGEDIDAAPTIDPESLRRKQTIVTNADWIRAMSDDELAKWLCGISTAECCDISCPGRDLCERGKNGMEKWLRMPYKTED